MRRLLIPGLILVIFIAIWLIQNKVETTSTSGKTIKNFLKLDIGKVDRISLKGGGGQFEFELIDGRWFLVDARPRPADSMAIKNVLTVAAELKAGTVISQNPEGQGDFMVDSVGGNLVQFHAGNRLLSQVIIGKMSPDFTNTYIRLPGKDEVYLAPGQLSFNFGRQRSQWLDRTILSLKPEEITQVEFIHPDKAYRIQRDSTRWFVAMRPYADGVEADSVKTNTFINRLSRLAANDFPNVDDIGRVNFDNPTLTLRILSAGSLFNLEFVSSPVDSLRFYGRRADLPDTVVLNKSSFDFLKKELSSFLP